MHPQRSLIVPVDAVGRVRLDALEAALATDPDDVALVSVMWANNEVGTIQPIAQIADLCKRRGIPLHSDAVQMLGQLERFDLAALGPQSPQFWHLFLESQRLAYADRELYIGDPDFVSVPVAGLLDPAYLARRSALIDPARRSPVSAGRPTGAIQPGSAPSKHR